MKNVILNMLPFNNRKDMTIVEYIIKKVLAFTLIYFVSALIGEVVVIGALITAGYDPLHGVMPGGEVPFLLQYYGFGTFILITLLYSKIIEKMPVKSFLKGSIIDYLFGSLIAIILLSVIIVGCCISGSISFIGINDSINTASLVLWLIAFIIQSGAEEVMVRGFLLRTLRYKVPTLVAVLVSSTSFVIPHLSSILDSEIKYAVVGMINLYLVSFIFSILFLMKESIWISCGLHFTWNFLLNIIMGLTLTGSGSVSSKVMLFNVNECSLINGGAYGIEAGIITSLILAVTLICIFVIMQKRGRDEDGIQ